MDIARLWRALAAPQARSLKTGRSVLEPRLHQARGKRILCHTYGRGKDQHIPIPGWPYSVAGPTR